ncbi:putative Fe-S oxidoreductase [Xenococcus sp. PCC 7305]|uniref:polysaccharide pyruvyl transferase family protein n=1 Tax=Xenococcus sp. PCC 7305 TaxID=102125 RepID=UPI0002ACCEF6|nr:polysaccharide pyruvyl transferase family protein [Xenococcus sp. PCC 7305]ELS02155.1 putative Fe-S oxidoreductase [Xenococcus sp. PCC 7305]
MSNLFKQAIKSKLTQKQLNIIRKTYSLSQLAYQDLRVNLLGQILPLKPTAISMMANDVCNSRCQMCLIWQEKKDYEMSPDDLAQVLSDPLFSNVVDLGITGGEPTLRKDLPELFRVACTSLPKLSSASMITNAIIENVVKQRIIQCAEVCRQYGKSFQVMVSLDGIGEVHETVRGRKGNFDSAIAVIDYLRAAEIPVTFGCTITNSNALYVDELLDFVKTKGLRGSFRVAEYINRLYNEEQTEYIRNFDAKTAYHLGLFFFRAEHSFELNSARQKTYRSIRGMLAEGKSRQTGCPYHTQTVILTSRGDLLYCSPKSPIIGNSLKESAAKLYFSNLGKRQEIIKDHCDDCIHDYHVPVNFREKVAFFFKSKRRHDKYNCQKLVKQAAQLSKRPRNIGALLKLTSKAVLIVGWYGTETAGDKAILWTIIKNLRSRSQPPEKIYLASLYPFISQWTIKEMALGEVVVVETFSPEFEQICDRADEVIVGGGPLMDLEVLNHLLYSFIQASKRGAMTRIEGCGIGPLVNPLYVQVVAEIMRLADHVTLRDAASAARGLNEFARADIQTVADPATDYVKSLKSQLANTTPILGKCPNVSCFFREWEIGYAGQRTTEEYVNLKMQFETELAKLVAFVAEAQDSAVHLLPMHSFQVGGDDRIFNRRLATEISSLFIESEAESRVLFARFVVSPEEILQTMYHSQFNICMRFHSVLFAEALSVPYLAIDYTGGGKITAFLTAKGQLDRLIPLEDVAAGKWQAKMESLLKLSQV